MLLFLNLILRNFKCRPVSNLKQFYTRFHKIQFEEISFNRQETVDRFAKAKEMVANKNYYTNYATTIIVQHIIDKAIRSKYQIKTVADNTYEISIPEVQVP